VDTTDLRDLVRFSQDEARRHTVVDSERMWCQVVCLQGNQSAGPMSDADAEGFCTVLSGEVALQVGRRRARMRQWEALHVPAGEPLTVTNASGEPSVVLLVLAPPPAAQS
jgi:glyoxylate utilization-related uncharacterized protein